MSGTTECNDRTAIETVNPHDQVYSPITGVWEVDCIIISYIPIATLSCLKYRSDRGVMALGLLLGGSKSRTCSMKILQLFHQMLERRVGKFPFLAPDLEEDTEYAGYYPGSHYWRLNNYSWFERHAYPYVRTLEYTTPPDAPMFERPIASPIPDIRLSHTKNNDSPYTVDKIWALRNTLVPAQRESAQSDGDTAITITDEVWWILNNLIRVMCRHEVPVGMVPMVIELIVPYVRSNAIHIYSTLPYYDRFRHIRYHDRYSIDRKVADMMDDMATRCHTDYQRGVLLALMTNGDIVRSPVVAKEVAQWMTRVCTGSNRVKCDTMVGCIHCYNGGMTEDEVDAVLCALLGSGGARSPIHDRLNLQSLKRVSEALVAGKSLMLRRLLAIYSCCEGWEECILYIQAAIGTYGRPLTQGVREVLMQYGVVVGDK